MIRQLLSGEIEYGCDVCQKVKAKASRAVLEKERWDIPNVKVDGEGKAVQGQDGGFVALGEVKCPACAPKRIDCFNCGVTELLACQRPGWVPAKFGERNVSLCPECANKKEELLRYSIRLQAEDEQEQKEQDEKDKAHAETLSPEEKKKLLAEKRAALSGKAKSRFDFECSVCKETFSHMAVMKEDAIEEFESRGFQFKPEKVCKKCLDEKSSVSA